MAFESKAPRSSPGVVEVIDLTQDSDFRRPTSQQQKAQIVRRRDKDATDIGTDDNDDQPGDDFLPALPFHDHDEFDERRAHRATSAPLPGGHRVIVSAISDRAGKVTVGETVEFSLDELMPSEFLKIIRLIRDQTNEVYMQGILLQRTSGIGGIFPKTCNELCAIIKARKDDRDPNIDEYLVERPLSSVIRIRDVAYTNQDNPAYSFDRVKWLVDRKWKDVVDEIRETEKMVCRWKYIEYCDTIYRKVATHAIMKLREHECDAGKGLSDVQLMLAWHHDPSATNTTAHDGGTAPTFHTNQDSGNPRKRKRKDAIDIDLTIDDSDNDVEEITQTFEQTFKRVDRSGIYEHRSSNTVTESFTIPTIPKVKRQPKDTNDAAASKSPSTSACRHTFGDICCCAGGASRAAQQAGLPVLFALDRDSNACASHRLNFPGCKTFNISIDEFCDAKFGFSSYMGVTVLHISFPCKYYSWAHTKDGREDNANEAAGYSVIQILSKIRPRVVTFEQTDNMIAGHRASFEALLHMLIDVGYSIRYKIVNFADYGNVHARRRLIIFASSPGEPLPPFPRPSAKRQTTIRDILRQVPRFIEPHMRQFTPKDENPKTDNRPLEACITTSGGEADTYPDGTRSFNLQELAQLAGFPPEHRFVGTKTKIRSQIGDAVPAMAFTWFFKEILASLKRFDQEVTAWKEKSYEREVITLD